MSGIIDANEVTIKALLDKSSEAYVVPRHQRQFEWSKEQWSDLWNDIHEDTLEVSHFLGSIVVIPQDGHKLKINKYEVNDGQQRLTTILILLSVIRDKARGSGNDDFADYIAEHYLSANYFEGGSKKVVPKMKLGKLDDSEFGNVLEGKLQNNLKDSGHLIYECYKYFNSEIGDLSSAELEELTNRIVDKIVLVHINVSDQFNAFRLFETLNDRGLALSAVDLIKNCLLMIAAKDADDASIDSIVEEWQEMYEKIRNYEPVTFLYRFVLSEYPGKILQTHLYEVIEQKAKKEKWDAKHIAEFTSKLNKAALIYSELLEANIGNKEVNRRLADIRLFEASPSYTLLMKITPFLKNGVLSDAEYLKVIDLIETFHVRWGICGQNTAILNVIYNRICSKLTFQNVEAASEIVEDEYLSFASKITDSAFHAAFQEKFVQSSAPRTKYFLWKLGRPAGEVSLNFDEVHTEHIMPQTLSKGWFSGTVAKTGGWLLEISEKEQYLEDFVEALL